VNLTKAQLAMLLEGIDWRNKNVERGNANEHSFFLVCVDVYEVQEILEMLIVAWRFRRH
jgi:hypothetical protein